jgi:hypothetical protein
MDIRKAPGIWDLDGPSFLSSIWGIGTQFMLETGPSDGERLEGRMDEVADILGFAVEMVHCTAARIDAACSTSK